MSQDNETISLQMRAGLRRLAKAVVVITTKKDGQRHAMAATAVSELSMDPPSMLICVNRSASLHPVLESGADFCINILDAAHMHISAACSGKVKGEARFEVGSWADSSIDVPRLDDAQASFVCRQTKQVSYGSHSIFIGDVVEVFSSPLVDPLVYVDGRYTRVGPDIVADAA
jgi:flavin reductase (DIM6/NTAB) family NADH-FMN oxidoreductase RutF